MTSKPSPWPPQPHRTLDEAPKPEPTPEDEDLAARIAAIDAELGKDT